MNIKDKLKYCRGCRNDFYNGNNNLGVKRCWSFDKAKVVWKKRVHINHVPPWKQKATRVLDCYHAQGYSFVGPTREY